MRTRSCDQVISSDITCPFGQLSQSPGYISDSLLTRSPLCIATPCDLHVLATPPAFRLSQDQTLQLNFLARVTPDARCGGCPLTESDTFVTRVCPRNEFVQTDRAKTSSSGCYCPQSGKGPGVSRTVLRTGSNLQGSNIFDGLLKQNDQGRSLTCVHHENA